MLLGAARLSALPLCPWGWRAKSWLGAGDPRAVTLAGTASFLFQIHLCRRKVASRSCYFYNNVEGKRGLLVSAQWGTLSSVAFGLLALTP